jgi:MFS superfamily sulfate permease-like transporter
MIIFLVDFLESLSIARAIARKYDYPIYPSREVTALGFSNIVGAMFGSYPSTGSFSRSAVAGYIGAKTTLQCFITGLLSFSVVDIARSI